MEVEFRDERAGREGVFDEWEEIGDEQEMGTFLVSWETGTDLEAMPGPSARRQRMDVIRFRRALRLVGGED